MFSTTSMQAAALLGINLERLPSPPTHARAPDPNDILIGPQRFTAVVGPSGSGKSHFLHQVAQHARAHARRFFVVTLGLSSTPYDPVACTHRPIIELIAAHTRPIDIERALRDLAAAGLAEGAIMLRPLQDLSAGEHARFSLALAMLRIRQHSARDALLIIDEFAAALDGPTAWSVASSLARFITTRPRTRLLVATHRREALEGLASAAFAPPRTIELSAGWDALAPRHQSFPAITIEPGTPRDYRALAPFHYRAAEPATIVRILVARLGPHRIPAGVLVISMPTLNSSWRRRAWPELFARATKHESARRLNHPREGVRCISRVIVDPRFRGSGVATALVRAYLRDPLTRRTEAVASMGRFTSFFERAGMRPIHLGIAPPDARLMDLLNHLGLSEYEVSAPARALERATRRAHRIHPNFLARELERWRRSSRAASTGPPDESLLDLFTRACARLGPRPIAFVTSQ